MSDKIIPIKSTLDNSTIGFEGPMVVEFTVPGDDYVSHYPVTYVTVNQDKTSIEAGNPDRVRLYELASPDDSCTIDESTQKLTFTVQGTIYTVRPFMDEDGIWASRAGVPVPAGVLEEILMDEATSDNGGQLDAEELYALTDDNDNVVYLIYMGADKTFYRDNGTWVELDDPNGDALDGYYIDQVAPAFVDVFDKQDGKGLTSNDLTGEVTDNVVTASAVSGFKFARPINKKG